MTTGTWTTVDGDISPNASSAAWPRHRARTKSSWLRGVTRRGKPPKDDSLRVIRFAAIALSLLVSIGWALIGAAIQIW